VEQKLKYLFNLYVFQQCQSKDAWKIKSDKYKQVLTRSLATVLGTLCFFLFRHMKVTPSYFPQHLVWYRDEHFLYRLYRFL